MRSAQIPGNDVNVVPMVWHLIALAMIDAPINASSLFLPKANNINIRHLGMINQGQLPVNRGINRLIYLCNLQV